MILQILKGGNMYHVYIKDDSLFDSKKLIGEFADLDKAYEKVDQELAKDKDIKYVIEETTGHVNSYGDLIADIVEEN